MRYIYARPSDVNFHPRNLASPSLQRTCIQVLSTVHYTGRGGANESMIAGAAGEL